MSDDRITHCEHPGLDCSDCDDRETVGCDVVGEENAAEAAGDAERDER